MSVATRSFSAPRRLIICLDGTWNSTYALRKRESAGEGVLKPSNVLKMCRAVLPHDATSGRDQIVYYDIGVGSLAEYPGIANKLLHVADKLLGGGFGAGFEGNIEDALGFLVANHASGDEVFVFGFSRGAATAQAMTRFLEWCGGLPSKNDAYYLPILFREYVVSKGDRSSLEVIAELNAKRAAEKTPRPPLGSFQAVNVKFLGVWDTVMALGSRFRATGTYTSVASRSFHVAPTPARSVERARQALAIDEARYDFRPEIWKGSDSNPRQSLEQRWFAGVHSNVGGGYVDDGLANVAFRWILAEATSAGLATDPSFTKHYVPYPQDRLYRSETFIYRLLDALRRRFGRGRRVLESPSGANLTVDKSAIQRLQADPARFPELQGKPYRPLNLLKFLAGLPNLSSYLNQIGLQTPSSQQLPPDVVSKLTKLRPEC